jgi:RND family efflux transporter MFP subunit
LVVFALLPPRALSRASFPRSIVAVTAIALLALPGCRQSSADEGDEPSAEEAGPLSGARRRERPRVRLTDLEQREMTDVLETTSKVESELEIEIFPRVSGTVLDVLAEEGDRVAAGQALCVLDDRDELLAVRDAEVGLDEARNAAEQATLAVEEALARVESAELASNQAQRDYDRNLRLAEDEGIANPLSEQALETSRLARDNAASELRQAGIAHRQSELANAAAKTAVARAEVALERARVVHSYMRVTAPFAGIVAQRSVRVGDTVSAAAAAFVLTDTENLRSVFYRPQEELVLFEGRRDDRGPLEFTATTEAYPGRTFLGEVVRISPTIDADSGQFRVTAKFRTRDESGQARLVPGMLVRMRIVTDRHPEALVVPKRALRREGNEHFVLVVADDVARRVAVEPGFDDDDTIEVIPAEEGALAVGDAVVLVGSRDIEDGDLVEVTDDADESVDEAPAADDTDAPAGE